MNRTRRSRLIAIAVVLIIPLVLMGCRDYEECAFGCIDLCGPLFGLGCMAVCPMWCANFYPFWYPFGPSQACTESPDECATTFEQMQMSAIEFCEEYPVECQQAFDTWVESLEEEAEE